MSGAECQHDYCKRMATRHTTIDVQPVKHVVKENITIKKTPERVDVTGSYLKG
jgi:hypothetical protein